MALLYCFGLPPTVDRTGATHVTGAPDHEEAGKGRLHDRISYVACALLVLGFALQNASNWIERSEASNGIPAEYSEH